MKILEKETLGHSGVAWGWGDHGLGRHMKEGGKNTIIFSINKNVNYVCRQRKSIE